MYIHSRGTHGSFELVFNRDALASAGGLDERDFVPREAWTVDASSAMGISVPSSSQDVCPSNQAVSRTEQHLSDCLRKPRIILLIAGYAKRRGLCSTLTKRAYPTLLDSKMPAPPGICTLKYGLYTPYSVVYPLGVSSRRMISPPRLA